MDQQDIVSQLSPPLDATLVELFIVEFNNIEQRYALGDWEPATLDGGQFAEIVSRLIYHIDSGNLNRRKGVNNCLKYIEDPDSNNIHCFPGNRRTPLHLCRVLRTIYKFRSQRGAVHIDPDYNANEIDVTFVMGAVRWILSELIRVFWTGSESDAARIVREIARYDIPAIFFGGESPLVMSIDCSAEEEILILLYNAGSVGMSRSELGKSIPKSSSTITNTIVKLSPKNKREITVLQNGQYTITPLGIGRVRSELSDKLRLS